MRIVLDTNVLVSALVYPGGAPEAVYRHVLERRVGLVTSAPLLTELVRVLVTKFKWGESQANEVLGQLSTLADIVEPSETVQVIEADPDDDRVLEAALEGSVSVIVSGDRHLLRLGEWRGIRVVNPAGFLSEFAD